LQFGGEFPTPVRAGALNLNRLSRARIWIDLAESLDTSCLYPFLAGHYTFNKYSWAPTSFGSNNTICSKFILLARGDTLQPKYIFYFETEPKVGFVFRNKALLLKIDANMRDFQSWLGCSWALRVKILQS